MDREKVLDDRTFVDAVDLSEFIQDWITDPSFSIKRNLRLEDGRGGMFSRAVLLEKRLSDGSYVYDVRLS